jgi:hypothetical protein
MIVAAISLANDSDQHAQPNEQENDDVRALFVRPRYSRVRMMR